MEQSTELPDDARVVLGRIELPKSWGDEAKIFVTCEGREGEHLLLTYFSDELSFTAEETKGLTVKEVRRLKFDKDQAYLKSK